MKSIIVLYHGNCRDGFSGAWAAWKKFGSRADYFPAFYRAKNELELPKGLRGKIVYLIDISLKKPGRMLKLVKENQRVISLDHHADAPAYMKLAQEWVFDNNRSGATIAWSYFHPKKPVPNFLKYVEDLDIWRHTMPNTFEISAYLDLFEHNFRVWNQLVKSLENSRRRKEIIVAGRLLLKYENKKIQDLVENNLELVKFCGIKTYAVNAPNWVSQIGNLLCEKLPPMAIIWRRTGKEIMVSLRSKAGGKFDVSKLARQFGGGGHKAASAFSWPLDKPLPWRTIRK